MMKTPCTLTCDVSNDLPYKFLEKKKNNNKLDGKYETIPQTAVAGTKHTITTESNKIIHRKLIRKTLPNSFISEPRIKTRRKRKGTGRAIHPTENLPTNKHKCGKGRRGGRTNGKCRTQAKHRNTKYINQKLWKPVSNSAPQFKSVEADPR